MANAEISIKANIDVGELKKQLKAITEETNRLSEIEIEIMYKIYDRLIVAITNSIKSNRILDFSEIHNGVYK